MGSTIYDVKVRYSADVDQAGRNILTLGDRAARAEKSAISLRGVLGALGTGLLFREGKKFLIDANAEVESLQLGMATVISMKLHEPFDRAREAASRLYDKFEDIAKLTPITTSQVARVGMALEPVILGAGGTTRDMLRLTQGTAIAATAFQMSPDQAALEVQQMLTHGIQARNRFGMMLMGDQRGEFNAALKTGDQGKALHMLDKRLDSPVMHEAAKAFGDSWQGQLTTLESGLNRVFRAVGLPLMKEMTAQLAKWNDWMNSDAGKTKLASWAKDVSAALVGGFHALQSAVSWVVSHRQDLLHIAEAFVALKVVGGIAGGIVGGGGGGGGVMGGVSAGFKLLAGALGPIPVALLAVGTALYLFRDQLADAGKSVLSTIDIKGAIEEKRKAEYYKTAAGKVELAAIQGHARAIADANSGKRYGTGLTGFKPYERDILDEAIAKSVAEQPIKAPIRPEVNVHIHKLEVAAEDPGRVVYELEEVADKANRYAMGSRHALAGM